MSDRPAINRSGGGIVSRGGERSTARSADDLPALMRGWRRRWTSGIAIATTAHEGALRGITLTAVMSVALDPPVLAISLGSEGEFLANLLESRRCAIHILDRDQDFLAERFAGRAPVPDRAFTGVPHEIVDGLPLLTGALAWAIGEVEHVEPVGDHALVILRVVRGALGSDTDDPLLTYEGRYRGLEAS